MQRFSTKAIVLARTDFGEADRIITFLTPDHGKVRGLARGVRKLKSKLAGGIELFSVSEISFIAGRGEINTIASTRLLTHYGNIVKDLDRTNAGYDFIKTLDKATADHPESGYFDLLAMVLLALDDHKIDLNLVKCWFNAELLKLAGHTPNLQTDAEGYKLEQGHKYDFNFDDMCFQKSSGRQAYGKNEVKFLRLLFSDNQIAALQRVEALAELTAAILPLLQAISRQQSY